MRDTSKLALIYPRQSTAVQTKENVYSLEHQLRLVELARRDGYPEDLIEVIMDDLGVSGKNITGRPGMLRAIALIERGLVSAFYCEDITRLSRDRDGVDYPEIQRIFRMGGVRLHMSGQWLDFDNLTDALNYDIQAAASKFYHGLHSDKMRHRKQDMARLGKITGRSCRGYRPNRSVEKGHPERDKPVPYEPEAEIIRAIVKLALQLGSYREVAAAVKDWLWPDGKSIDATKVHRILTWPMYRGDFVYCIYKKGRDGKRVLVEKIYIENNHPALISPAEQAKIDLMRATNLSARRKKAEKGNQLAGLIWCADCDRKVGSGHRSRLLAYTCHQQAPDREIAYHFSISSKLLENIFEQSLYQRLIHENLLARIIAKMQGTEVADVDLAAVYLSQIAEQESKIENWMEAVGMTKDAATKALFVAKIVEARETIEEHRQKIPKKPEVVERMVIYQDMATDPLFIQTLPFRWSELDLDQKRQQLRLWIERVEIRDRGATYDMTIHYQDGESRTVPIKHYRWGAHERALFNRLMIDPERPDSFRDSVSWLHQKMEESGSLRSFASVRGLYHASNLHKSPRESQIVLLDRS